MLEKMVKSVVEESDPELKHKMAKWALGGFAALLVEHFIRKGYDIALEAYRTKRG
jgi:hypothetical protein